MQGRPIFALPVPGSPSRQESPAGGLDAGPDGDQETRCPAGCGRRLAGHGERCAQALAMRGVLPTRLAAVVEAATMDVLCDAPPLADGASAASWRNHLATHGRTLK